MSVAQRLSRKLIKEKSRASCLKSHPNCIKSCRFQMISKSHHSHQESRDPNHFCSASNKIDTNAILIFSRSNKATNSWPSPLMGWRSSAHPSLIAVLAQTPPERADPRRLGPAARSHGLKTFGEPELGKRKQTMM